jgi:hypothetical protein
MNAESRPHNDPTTARWVSPDGHKTEEIHTSEWTREDGGEIAPDRATCSVAGCSADAAWAIRDARACDLHRAVADEKIEGFGVPSIAWRALARSAPETSDETGHARTCLAVAHGLPEQDVRELGLCTCGRSYVEDAERAPACGSRDGARALLVMAVPVLLFLCGCDRGTDAHQAEPVLWILGLFAFIVSMAVVASSVGERLADRRAR